MHLRTLCSWRALVAAGVLALGLVAGPLTAGHAGATFTTCQNCPQSIVVQMP